MAGFKWLVFVFLVAGFFVGVGLWWLGFVFCVVGFKVRRFWLLVGWSWF